MPNKISSKYLYSLLSISSKKNFIPAPKKTIYISSTHTQTTWIRKKKRSSFLKLLTKIRLSKRQQRPSQSLFPTLSLKQMLLKLRQPRQNYTFQSPFVFSLGNQEDQDPFTPEYLIRESLQDHFEEPDTSHQITLLANLRLPLIGKLKCTNKGFYYLDISDRYIDALFPLISEPTAQKASRFCDLGAHIPVILQSEASKYQLHNIPELDNEYSFVITKFLAIKPQLSNKYEKVWLLTIAAKELQYLREKYHLPSKIRSHDFSIAIGVQKKAYAPLQLNPQPKHLFRINVANLPA